VSIPDGLLLRGNNFGSSAVTRGHSNETIVTNMLSAFLVLGTGSTIDGFQGSDASSCVTLVSGGITLTNLHCLDTDYGFVSQGGGVLTVGAGNHIERVTDGLFGIYMANGNTSVAGNTLSNLALTGFAGHPTARTIVLDSGALDGEVLNATNV